tara:strand:+ start:2299 stop:2718 length:420 start_codon:yes stop_codon:yes gene_type:complete
MASLNKVQIIGRLGKDPETRMTPSGAKAVSFSVAISEKYKGEEKTEWINVVLWNKVADIAEQYLKKGSEVYIEGKMQTSSWEQDGQKKYKTEVIGFTMQMLGSKQDNQGQAQGGFTPSAAPSPAPTPGYFPNPQEDLPF